MKTQKAKTQQEWEVAQRHRGAEKSATGNRIELKLSVQMTLRAKAEAPDTNFFLI